MPTPLKRQIGWKRPVQEKKPVAAKVEGTPLDSPMALVEKRVKPSLLEKEIRKQPEPPTGAEVAAWIKAHPLFKVSGMCTQIGIDKANFYKDINSKAPSLKNGVLAKVVKVISQYGFRK